MMNNSVNTGYKPGNQNQLNNLQNLFGLGGVNSFQNPMAVNSLNQAQGLFGGIMTSQTSNIQSSSKMTITPNNNNNNNTKINNPSSNNKPSSSGKIYKKNDIVSWVNSNNAATASAVYRAGSKNLIPESEIKAWLYCWLMKRKVRPEYTIETLGTRPTQKFSCKLILNPMTDKSTKTLRDMRMLNIEVTSEGLRVGVLYDQHVQFRCFIFFDF